MLLSLIFVWVFITGFTTRQVAQTKQIREVVIRMLEPVASMINLSKLLMCANESCMIRDYTHITKLLKIQMLELCASGRDLVNSPENIDKMVSLLILYQAYEDTSDLLDSNPSILEYIFSMP